MQLRAFHCSDLPILHEIDQACFPPGVSYSKTELGRFVSERGSRTWIAEEEGQIVGFLIAAYGGPRIAHIVTIDVRLECRRRGVGRILMEHRGEMGQRSEAGIDLSRNCGR